MKNRNGLVKEIFIFLILYRWSKKKPPKNPDYLISTKIYKMEHKKKQQTSDYRYSCMHFL